MLYDSERHSLAINTNLFKQINIKVWQNPNDPDDENEHFRQPHIAIEQHLLEDESSSLNNYS